MTEKWLLLALLFLGRCLMGMQFESIGALGPLLRVAGVDYGQLGVLVGAYLAPGVVVSFPGGVLAQRLGDRTTILLCLALLGLGGSFDLFSDQTLRLCGRVVAGTGGIVLSLAAAKIIMDRFCAKHLAIAMAVFANAWPCGIALSLICLPLVAQSFGLRSASLLMTALVGILLVFTLVVVPRAARSEISFSSSMPRQASLLGVCVLGVLWGIANAAFTTIFAFGPVLLVEKGYVASAAASRISIVLWVMIPSILVGGLLASRAKLSWLICVSLALAAVLMAAVQRLDSNVGLFVGIGIISGLSAAALMTLPSLVLEPRKRAVGMGILYSINYALMVALPVLQGTMAQQAQSAAIAFDIAAVSLLAAIPLLLLFGALARRSAKITLVPA